MQPLHVTMSLRVSLLACVLGAAACSGPLRYTPRPTSHAPEADPTIVADVHRDQGMTNLQVRVEHLAPPERINAGATAFVVWSRSDGAAPWLRVGMLTYNPSSRLGELTATTPNVRFELMITAENSSAPPQPSQVPVATQMVGAPN